MGKLRNAVSMTRLGRPFDAYWRLLASSVPATARRLRRFLSGCSCALPRAQPVRCSSATAVRSGVRNSMSRRWRSLRRAPIHGCVLLSAPRRPGVVFGATGACGFGGAIAPWAPAGTVALFGHQLRTPTSVGLHPSPALRPSHAGMACAVGEGAHMFGASARAAESTLPGFPLLVIPAWTFSHGLLPNTVRLPRRGQKMRVHWMGQRWEIPVQITHTPIGIRADGRSIVSVRPGAGAEPTGRRRNLPDSRREGCKVAPRVSELDLRWPRRLVADGAGSCRRWATRIHAGIGPANRRPPSLLGLAKPTSLPSTAPKAL